jgi:hypothetical protein
MFGGASSSSSEDSDASEPSDDKQLLDSLKKQLGKDAVKNIDKIPSINSAVVPARGVPLMAEDKVDPVVKKAPLSSEEAEDLQKRLDNLTDEQVEKVFAKMRAALTSRAKEEVQAAMEERRSEGGGSKPVLPKAEVSDPEVRKKYNKELSIIEEELEGMYNDPLKVWQDIMMNPTKFTGDEPRLDDEELQ